MNIRLTPELEARIAGLASREGTSPEEFIVATITDRLEENDLLHSLRENAAYQDAVQRGIEAADRGELIEHTEVMANLEKILRV